MKREIRTTSDGSKTLYVSHWDECYHSVHGAHQESMHVFIDKGLNAVKAHSIRIVEYGFGTGLNALLSVLACENSKRFIHYTGLEKYPVSKEEWNAVEYGRNRHEIELFTQLHEAEWNRDVPLNPFFTLHKIETDFATAPIEDASIDLIYYDAFAPSAQPELWTEEAFKRCFDSLKPGGILVTYCAKGQVKRNMKSVGFQIEALPGPPGKREMTRAVKPISHEA